MKIERFLECYANYSSKRSNTTRNTKYIDRSERLSENDILHCFPFVRTGWPDQSSCNEVSAINNDCPARSVYS